MDESEATKSWWSYLWAPTVDPLVSAETALFQTLKKPYEQRFVQAGAVKFNTIIMGRGPPLLLLHGFGSGVGQWVRNLDSLSSNFTVYACDLIGFGRSDRPDFYPQTPQEAEDFFVDHLHNWIEALGFLERNFILAGHSFGAYLTTCYMIKFNTTTCKKIILIDAWGIKKKPEDTQKPTTWRGTLITNASNYVLPFAFVRAAGPWGKNLLSTFRSDLISKFDDWDNPEIFLEYIHAINSRSDATGERVFQELKIPFAWAKRPLQERFHLLDPLLPVSFIYGTETWMPRKIAFKLATEYDDRKINVYDIENAGHHVMLDNERDFNTTMGYISQQIKQRKLVEVDAYRPRVQNSKEHKDKLEILS